MIIKSLKWVMSLVLAAGLVLLFFTAMQQDEDAETHRATLPSTERTGEIEWRNDSIYLHAFDFEGKRCLWATASPHYAGLTCWEPK